MSAYTEFSQIYDLFFPLKENVYRFLKSFLTSGQTSVLDIGCGTGHYCARFADEGYTAVGIDPDAGMIEIAKKKTTSAVFYLLAAQQIEKLNQQFDLVFSIGNSMSHLSRDDFNFFLTKLRHLLKPDGLWIFQVVNWDRIIAQGGNTFPIITNDETGLSLHRQYAHFSENQLLFKIEIKDKNDKSVLRSTQPLYPLPSEECIRLHQENGFILKAHYGDYNSNPFRKADSGASIYIFSLSSL